jgi:hypothetical protein
MSERWEIWLDTPTGTRLELLSGMYWTLTKVASSPGFFSVTLPADFDHRKANPDYLIEFWRGGDNARMRLESVGFVRKKRLADDSQGNETTTLTGFLPVELLRRRIVAYAAGSAQADKTDQADDMMKAIVTQNLGASAVAGRDLTALGVTVAADLADGPSVTKGFAWKNVYTTLQEIAEASRQAGTNLYFDFVPSFTSDTAIGFQFRTYINQPGQDHSYTTGTNPVMFSKEWGNLVSPSLEMDYDAEINACYVGGQGEGADRATVTRTDAGRIAASVWNRREAFADARNESATNGLNAKGDSVLAENRPRYRFSGTLIDSPQARYGIDWDFGDRATISYRGLQFDGTILAVTLAVGQDGKESITAKVDIDL